VTVETVNAMSGRVPTARCINDPMAAQYGTLFMCPISSADCGDWSHESLRPGSIGMEADLQLARLYLAMQIVQSLTLVKVGHTTCTFACKSGTSQRWPKHCKPRPG